MIYRILSDSDNFLTLDFDKDELARQEFHMGGALVIHPTPEEFKLKWESIDTSFVDSDNYERPKRKKREKRVPDIYQDYGHLYLTDKAKEILEPHLSSYGEVLPLNGACAFMFNPLEFIETDEDSKMDPILLIPEKIVFNQECMIFRTAFDGYRGVYCNDEFVRLCMENDLEGIVFDSELHNGFFEHYAKRERS